MQEKNGVFILNQKLYTQNVSKLFLEIIKPYLAIDIVVEPKKEKDILEWSVEVITAQQLEDIYVGYFAGDNQEKADIQDARVLRRLQESLLRKRFQDYLQKLQLYSSPNQKLHIDSFIEDNFIKVKS